MLVYRGYSSLSTIALFTVVKTKYTRTANIEKRSWRATSFTPDRDHVTRMAPTRSATALNAEARRQYAERADIGRVRTRASRRQPRFLPSFSVCRGVSCRPAGALVHAPFLSFPPSSVRVTVSLLRCFLIGNSHSRETQSARAKSSPISCNKKFARRGG